MLSLTPKTVLLTLLVISVQTASRNRGGDRSRTRFNQNLNRIRDSSSVLSSDSDSSKAAKIVKNSHFSQTFKLGYKVLLICETVGQPTPHIYWYKDGAELKPKLNLTRSDQRRGRHRLRSKIEIDPAVIGDRGDYTCIATNRHGKAFKVFQVDYYYHR